MIRNIYIWHIKLSYGLSMVSLSQLLWYDWRFTNLTHTTLPFCSIWLEGDVPMWHMIWLATFRYLVGRVLRILSSGYYPQDIFLRISSSGYYPQDIILILAMVLTWQVDRQWQHQQHWVRLFKKRTSILKGWWWPSMMMAKNDKVTTWRDWLRRP